MQLPTNQPSLCEKRHSAPFDMTSTHRFVCLGESPEDQAKCRFYRPFAENDAWCVNSYDNKGRFGDICHLAKAREAAQ